MSYLGAKISPLLPALATAHPPLCLQWRDGAVHNWLALLWYLLSPLFCEQARVCFRLELFVGKFSLSLFISSLAIPHFGLLIHISSLRLSSGHPGPVLTLSNAACASLFSPHSLLVDASIWATSPLGVAVRRIICSSFFFFFFPFWLCCLLRFKTPHRPIGERISWCLETSPPSRLPPQDGSLSLSLFSLLFCPTSFRREWATFPGALSPPPVFRCCFVEFIQRSYDFLMNLWGRNWSLHPIPSPSSTSSISFIKKH